MNIIKALETGLPFKRPSYSEYVIRNPLFNAPPAGSDKTDVTFRQMVEEKQYPFIWETREIMATFTETALMANDWEVRPNDKKIPKH